MKVKFKIKADDLSSATEVGNALYGAASQMQEADLGSADKMSGMALAEGVSIKWSVVYEGELWTNQEKR